jgi:uncharacterized protein
VKTPNAAQLYASLKGRLFMENAQPEPSMEEILASIRRIISEDEEEAPPAALRPTPAQKAATQTEERITPLKQESEPRGQSDTTKTHTETEDVEMINKNVAEAMENDTGDTILNESSAAAASEAFRNLSQSVRVSDGEGRTVEDIVVQMLKPMIKDWLNENLPTIVEEKVEEEVQRVARRRRG